MKLKYFILSLILSASFTTLAQDCNIGNSVITSDYEATHSFFANSLGGTRFTLEHRGTLNSINMIGNGTGAGVRMAVYSLYNNKPGNLVAESNAGIVSNGLITLPTTPVFLEPGEYYIMAIYDTDGYHCKVKESPLMHYASFQFIDFNSELPYVFTHNTVYSALHFPYYLDITCPPTSDCNIGNSVSNSNFNDSSFSANNLLGTKYALSKEGILNSINLIGNGTGANVKMAVYDDNNGEPNNLITSSNLGAVGDGIVSFDVDPIVLPPGDYWIMAVYNAGGNHSNVNTSATGNTVYYKSHSFWSAIPSNASDFSSYSGQDFLYFLEISCTLPSECNIGNSVDTPDYADVNFGSNNLTGIKYSLPQEGTLNSINLMGNGTYANVQMAVYDDNNGSPDNLVASSNMGKVGFGRVALPVTPVVLPAGDYWIMAVYDATGLHTKNNTTITGSTVYYQNLTFGDPIPSNASSFNTISGSDYLYFLDITCSTTSTCGIGNSALTSDFYPNLDLSGYFGGVKYTLYEQGVLDSINLLGTNTGAGVQMAVYDDNNGVPNNLIAVSSIGTVGEGRVTLPVDPVVLQPGVYWIMAIYDTEGEHTYRSTSSIANTYYYKAMAFGETIPGNASNFSGGNSSRDLTYFLDIECFGDVLSTPDYDLEDNITLYPNPSSSFIKISGLKERGKYTLFDSLGRRISNNEIGNNESINIQNLDTGLYFIKFESGSTLKFIKK